MCRSFLLSSMESTKENENKEVKLAVPGSSDMNTGDHPVNPQLQQHPSSPSSVPLETNSITSHTTYMNAESYIQPHSTPSQHSPSSLPVHNDQPSLDPGIEIPFNINSESSVISLKDAKNYSPSSSNYIQTAEATTDTKTETSSVSPPKSTANSKTEPSSALSQSKANCDGDPKPICPNEPELLSPCPSSGMKLVKDKVEDVKNGVNKPTSTINRDSNPELSFLLDDINFSDGNESGTEEEQSVFMKQLEIFFKERGMEFKPPKFYGEGLNCLK